MTTGIRPTIEGLRTALDGGSARTLLAGLNRYWRDLGSQVAGSPDTLRRLPAAFADLAEGSWERALSLALDASQASSTEAEGHLSRLKGQLELRQRTLSQREVELSIGSARFTPSRDRGTSRHIGENLGQPECCKSHPAAVGRHRPTVLPISRLAGVSFGGSNCHPNLLIFVTAYPRELLQAMEHRRYGVLFGHATSSALSIS